MADETFGDRLSDQGCYAKTRRSVRDRYQDLSQDYARRPILEDLSNGDLSQDYSQARARCVALIVATCLMMAPLVSTPSRLRQDQHLVSPGGIQAGS
jgi:hypothetical protein